MQSQTNNTGHKYVLSTSWNVSFKNFCYSIKYLIKEVVAIIYCSAHYFLVTVHCSVLFCFYKHLHICSPSGWKNLRTLKMGLWEKPRDFLVHVGPRTLKFLNYLWKRIEQICSSIWAQEIWGLKPSKSEIKIFCSQLCSYLEVAYLFFLTNSSFT